MHWNNTLKRKSIKAFYQHSRRSKIRRKFFCKSSISTSKATASCVETSDFAQDTGPSASQTSHRSCVDTSPVGCKGRDNSHFTVWFTKYTLQLCRCTPGVLQTTVSRLSNSKACFTWIKKYVIYGGIWPRPILPTGNSERNNSREFILDSTLWWDWVLKWKSIWTY